MGYNDPTPKTTKKFVVTVSVEELTYIDEAERSKSTVGKIVSTSETLELASTRAKAAMDALL